MALISLAIFKLLVVAAMERPLDDLSLDELDEGLLDVFTRGLT